MTLGELVLRVRRQLPAATVESIPDSTIWGELNIGVNYVNRKAQVYQGYTEFSFVLEQQIYSISDIAPNYLGIVKSGIWWKDDSDTFKYRIATTRRWLDSKIPNWRDASSGVPFWYWIDGDELGFYVKPSTAWTCRIYHLMKAVSMDNANNYPWKNTTTEVTSLQPLDDAIVSYAIWKLSAAVGKDSNATPEEALFLREIQKGMQEIRRRKDLTSDVDAFMRMDTNLI